MLGATAVGVWEPDMIINNQLLFCQKLPGVFVDQLGQMRSRLHSPVVPASNGCVVIRVILGQSVLF